MATITEIGALISRRPEIREGRPCISGTSVSVRRIAVWHNMGLIPEEIARKFGHLSLAQIYAAHAYYHANQDEIDADLETEAHEAAVLEELHRISSGDLSLARRDCAGCLTDLGKSFWGPSSLAVAAR